MAYLATLLLAGVWAVMERTRAVLASRSPAQTSSVGLDVDAAESMTARELDVEREAAELLLRA